MPGFDPSVSPNATDLAYAFVESRLVVHPEPDFRVPVLSELAACGPVAAGPFPIGRVGERPTVALSLPAGTTCDGLELRGLRELFGLLAEPEMQLAARAFQILEWSAAHEFCGRCGSATVYSSTELARTCLSCGATYFPRITPAVIALVRRGPEILLARGKQWGPRFYSLIAGYVEPGETLEQAVVREIVEEVGITVMDIEYFGSQSWPFPSQLMVGYVAKYASGELRVNEHELSDARWFRIADLPGDIQLPTTFSISGQIISSVLLGGEPSG